MDATVKNWLVTGGCGFIGRSLIRSLLAGGVPEGRIRVLDNLSVGDRSDLAQVASILESSDWSDATSGVGLIVGDIRDRKAVGEAIRGAGVVVHLAACTGVQPSVDDPHFDCETNVIGTLNCLDAARHAATRRFVFASSGAPLGEVTPPIHEEVVPRPISPYGASKLAGEAYCSAYHGCFGLETVALRFGNVYGPLASRKSSIVAKFIKQAMAGEKLEIYGDGTSTRDYIFTEDLVEAIRRAATMPGVAGEVFQIATSKETSVLEILEKLVAALAEFGISGFDVVHADKRRGDMPRNYSDTSKAQRILAWRSKTSLDEGLRRTVRWFVEQATV